MAMYSSLPPSCFGCDAETGEGEKELEGEERKGAKAEEEGVGEEGATVAFVEE